MSETAAEDPTEGTGGVEGRRVHLDPLAGLGGRSDKEILPGEDGGRGTRRFVGGESSVWIGAGHLIGGGIEEARDQGMLRRFHGRRRKVEMSRVRSDLFGLLLK